MRARIRDRDSRQADASTFQRIYDRMTNGLTPRRMAGALLLLAGLPLTGLPGGAALGQEAPVRGTTVLLSSDLARLELDLPSGSRTIELSDGSLLLDGNVAGTYEVGGAFERAFRALLRSPDLDETEGLATRLDAWEPPGGGSAREAVVAAFDALVAPPDAAATTETSAADGAAAGRVTIVPRAGSIGQLAERLQQLGERLDRIAGVEFDLENDFALVVNDDYTIAEGTSIDGDVALVGGTLRVGGRIDGNVLVLDGFLDLEPGASVAGDVRSVGGRVDTQGAAVAGEILQLSEVQADVERAVDRAVNRTVVDAADDGEWSRHRRTQRGFFGSILHTIGEAVGGFLGTVGWLIGLTLFGSLFIYFTPKRLDQISSAARGDLMRCFGIGLAGQFLVGPVLLVLCLLIVTWLVIPFYLLAVAVAIPVGYIAVARGLGEAVVDRRYASFERLHLNRDNTYYYLFNGLVVLLAPIALSWLLHLLGGWFGFLQGMMLFLGIVLNWAAGTVGFGAVLLTRGGGLATGLRWPRGRRGRASTHDPFADPAADEIPIDE